MSELNNYSGEFNPDFKFEDLTREALLRLVKEYSRLYLILQGSWHSTLRERIGDRANIDLDCYQWMMSAPANAHWLSRAMNIKAENVASYFKALQLDPAFPLALFDVEYELVNPDHGFFTCKRCTALDAYEAEGTGHEIVMCHEEETATFAYAALYHHPEMVVRPVKLPPRKNRYEIACKWECKIVPGFLPTASLSRDQMRQKIFEKTRSSGAIDVRGQNAVGKWSEKTVGQYWQLLPDTTKELLKVIAKKPDGCLKDDIIEELGIRNEELSFRFGYVYLPFYIGNFPPLDHPVRLLTNPWRYEMDKNLSHTIMTIIKEEL